MKKYSNQIIIILSILTLILVILNKNLISSTILSSFYIWYNTLVPSMFPMIILSEIIITYSTNNIISSKMIQLISKIFNISNNASIIFLLSTISGFPTNAITIQKAISNNSITKEEGEHLLLFCNFANPLFILQTIGTFYLKNKTYALIILTSHFLSNIIIGIIFKKNNNPKNNYILDNSKSQSFIEVLNNAIYKSVNSLLFIAGTITLFLVLTTLIANVFTLNTSITLLIKGILEMTTALSFLSNLNLSNILKVILSTSILSFSGLSIHLQVISTLNNNIKYKYYLKGRVLSTIISGLISFIIMKLI